MEFSFDFFVAPVEEPSGMGKIVGIVLAIGWGLTVVCLLVYYLPKKKQHLLETALDNQNISDRKLFKDMWARHRQTIQTSPNLNIQNLTSTSSPQPTTKTTTTFMKKIKSSLGMNKNYQSFKDDQTQYSIESSTGKEEKQTTQDANVSSFSEGVEFYSSKNTNPNFHPFNFLPNEIMTEIFLYLDAFELGMVAQVSKRFHTVASASLLWRELCFRYWTEDMETTTTKSKPSSSSSSTPQITNSTNPTDLTLDPNLPTINNTTTNSTTTTNSSTAKPSSNVEPPREFFVAKFSRFRQEKKLAKRYRFLTFFRSTLIAYVLCFSICAQLYVLGLKLDKTIDWNWFIIAIPSWLMLTLFTYIVSIFTWNFYRSKATRNALRRVFGWINAPFIWMACSFMILCVAQAVVLVYKFQNDLQTKSWNWWAVLSPGIALGVLSLAIPSWVFFRPFRWSGFWFVLFISLCVLSFLLGIGRLQGNLTSDWCVILLPYWISDIFALICAISFCIELRTWSRGCGVSIACGLYLGCAITFRTLVCVNWGDYCSASSQYQYSGVFVPIHLMIALFGIPTTIFFRKISQKLA